VTTVSDLPEVVMLQRLRRGQAAGRVLVLPWWCYSGVTVTLQWCYTSIAVVFLWCHRSVTAVLQSCYSAVVFLWSYIVLESCRRRTRASSLSKRSTAIGEGLEVPLEPWLLKIKLCGKIDYLQFHQKQYLIYLKCSRSRRSLRSLDQENVFFWM
jgi:hypothetical protein